MRPGPPAISRQSTAEANGRQRRRPLRGADDSSLPAQHSARSTPHYPRRGAALLLVLWTIALLALLVGGLSHMQRQDLAIGRLQHERRMAHWMARAGVERALSLLTDDVSLTDGASDAWQDTSQLQDIGLEGGSFSVIHSDGQQPPRPLYGVEDESGKLNLNAASAEQLAKLPKMTESIAAAIIDWRDSDTEPQQMGVEGGHYESLVHPYKIRNGPFRSVRELLLVRDVTPDLFFGEDTNGNGLLDPNENDGTASPPADNGDGRLDTGWFAWVTAFSYEKNENAIGQKRLHLNEADANTLATRCGVESWAAESVVKRREQNEFQHLVDLLEVPKPSDVERGDPSEDINSRSRDEQDKPITRSIFISMVDELTLSDQEALPGRINLNTAAQEVLEALPGIDVELANAIVSRQQGGGFGSIGELLDISGMTTQKFGELEDKVTVRSEVFRIQSEGRGATGLGIARIECVIDRGQKVPRVLYWLESSP